MKIIFQKQQQKNFQELLENMTSKQIGGHDYKFLYEMQAMWQFPVSEQPSPFHPGSTDFWQ